MASSVCVSRCQMLLKIDLNRFGLNKLYAGQQNATVSWCRRIRHTPTQQKRFVSTGDRVSNKKSSDSDDEKEKKRKLKLREGDDDVKIVFFKGLPQITVPLPSRKEECRFTLKPISNTVGDFIAMVQREDKGIDRISLTTCDGVRIASSNTIESLLEDKFKLILNDTVYTVEPPESERLTQEEVKNINDVRSLIHQLYEALNVGEHQLKQERDLCVKLETLRSELQPLENKRLELDKWAQKKCNYLVWGGLGVMAMQFGILARLTWWEYSWDIMEPVTYFVTYGTSMMFYAYYCLTKQEYYMHDVKDREYLITLHKKSKKVGLDIPRYNHLKEEISRAEKDLKTLRDPLQMHLPPYSLIEHGKSKELKLNEALNEARIKRENLELKNICSNIKSDAKSETDCQKEVSKKKPDEK